MGKQQRTQEGLLVVIEEMIEHATRETGSREGAMVEISRGLLPLTVAAIAADGCDVLVAKLQAAVSALMREHESGCMASLLPPSESDKE